MIIKRMALSLLSVVSAVYIGIGGLLYAGQDDLIFYPDVLGRELATNPNEAGWDYEEVWLEPEPGLAIHGWFIPHPEERGVLLFCHGNAGNIGHRLEYVALLRELGLSVLLFDYRGFGRSQGRPSEEGMYRDANAALEYLVQSKGYNEQQVLVLGRSLGGAVASHLSRGRTLRGLFLESTFTSVVDMAAQMYPLYPVRWLSKYQFNTLAHLEQTRVPVLIAHSREDELVPFKHAQQLFDGAAEPKVLVPLQGGHNDAYQISALAYRAALRRFLGRHQVNAPRPARQLANTQ